MTEARIAVAGNQWITHYLIEKMINNQIKPDLIINLDLEKSKDISGYYDLQKIADKYEIEIFRPQLYSLKSDIDRDELSKKNIDILLVFGWQRLIPEWFINICKLGVYGVHGGPEKPPRCRGRAVFNWAIILGYSRFYMYMFKITPGIDEGAILDICEFDINLFDDIVSIYHKNCIVSSEMIIRKLPDIISNKVIIVKQSDENPTYLPKRIPAYSGINWDLPAVRLINLIRAVAPPYPGAFSFIDSIEVFIYRAHIFDTKLAFPEIESGTIIEVFENGDFIVKAFDYPIYVRDYSCENKQIISKGKQFQLHSGELIADPVI